MGERERSWGEGMRERERTRRQAMGESERAWRQREYIRDTDCLCVSCTRMAYVCDCTVYGGGSDLMRKLVTGLCGVNIDRWPLSY